MADARKALATTIGFKLTLAFLAMAIFIALIGLAAYTQLSKVALIIDQEISAGLVTINQTSHLNSHAQAIRYYDEVLTQSARNYAFTGDEKWERRYLEAEPKLDRAIKEAIAEGDTEDARIFSEVDSANAALVRMEHESMRLVEESRSEEAIAMLEGEEYQGQKEIYSAALQEYVASKGSTYEQALIVSTARLTTAAAEAKSQIASGTMLLFGTMGVLLIGAIVLGYTTSRAISKPLGELYAAAKELEAGKYSTRVKISTGDELEQLGAAFNDAAQALGKMDEERRQVEKAKTQFLSITSHELRSPMTPMKAQLQMMEQGYLGKLSRRQKESLQIVLRNAERLDKILVDFLEISRIEAARLKFEFKKTDLAKVAHEVAEYMGGYLPEKRVSIRLKVGKIRQIEADEARVSQVLRNLISNAIKFSQDGGVVEVGARESRDFVEFWVKDSGIGISEENQKRLFEPFYQADKTFSRKEQGTGLGLPISRGIVQAQGGRIWLESALGKGTTFHFTVPFEPVREMKSVKVLFSSKGEDEAKALAAFKEFLGPMGEPEFSRLLKEGKANREGLREYIESLRKEGVVSRQEAERFEKSLPEGI